MYLSVHSSCSRNWRGDRCQDDEDDAGALSIITMYSRGVEWLSYSDRMEARPMPLPRSLANIKREITEKKWAGARQWARARQWAGGGASKKKYKRPESHKPDGAVAGSTKTRSKVLSAEGGALPHWTALTLGKGSPHRPPPRSWDRQDEE